MQIGMMGLGRMGANMVRRLMRDGHECVVYDINPAPWRRWPTARSAPPRWRSSSASCQAAQRLADAAGGGHATSRQVSPLMEPGDIIIDGGNSYYHDAVDRAERLAPKGMTMSMSAPAAASGASTAAIA